MSEQARDALAEYVLRQQAKGRKEMTTREVEIVIHAIQATLREPEEVFTETNKG